MEHATMLPASPPHWRFSRAAFTLIVFCIGLVTVKPAVEIVSPVKNQIIRYRNESLLFNCTVTPPGRVNKTSFQWKRNEDLIDPPGKTNTPSWSSFELKKGLQPGDEGVYECISDVGSNTVEVHLAEKPKAVPGGNTSPIPAKLDETTQLNCKGTGWPTPNITWFRNGRNVLDINQDHFYDVRSVAAGYSELDILFTQWQHEGWYTCMAWNAVGEYNASLQVQIATDYTWIAEKTKYTAVVGTDAKLVCIGQGVYLSNINYTSLSWVFNGTEIKITGHHYRVRTDYYIGSHGKFSTQLTVRNVMYADSGNYTCRIVTLDGRTTNDDNILLEVKAEGKEKRLKIWMIAIISVVAAILTLLLMTFIMVVCLRRRRKKKLLAIAQKYDQEEHVFEHDLFISYSTKDYDWVQQSLLPVLDESGIDYIIHSRDFVPGKAWLDNMADSVYNSRKVILIMSCNYLSSAFCRDEMRMAIHRCSERDDSSLIVVRIDNIKSNDIPKSVRHRTFIDVTSKEETTTWQRRILDYALSVVSSGSVASDESFNDTDTKSLLSMFKLKKKKNRNSAERDLENQAKT